MDEPSGLAASVTVRRVLGACIRRLPVVVVLTTLMTGGALIILRHLPPAYTAHAVVWLGSREAAILASPSAWSALGRPSASLDEGKTMAAVFTSVPVLRRVVMSLELYDRPDDLRPRLSGFMQSLRDSVMPSETINVAAGSAPLREQPIQLTALQSVEAERTDTAPAIASPWAANTATADPTNTAMDATDMEARIRGAVADLQAGLEVSVDMRSEIAAISFSGPDPALAAQVVNAIPAAFAMERRERMRDGTSGAAKWLAARVDDAREDVQAIERQIEKVTAETLSGLSPASDAEGRIAALTEEVEDAQERLRDARSRIDRSRAEIASNTIGTTVFDSEIMTQLLNLRAGAVGQRRELLTRVSEDHALVRDIEAKIAGLDSDIIAEKRRLLSDLEADSDAAANAVARAEERLAAAQAEVATVLERKNQATAAVSGLERDLDAAKSLYNGLVARLQEARQVAQLDDDSISLIQPALVPQSPSSIGRPVLVAAAGFVSFMFALAAIAGLALLDRRILLPGQVRATGLSTLVSAPFVPRAKLRARRASFLFQEAIRRLFALTLYDGARTEAKCMVLVTSGAKGEGKTTVARALATCAVATDTSTVLIDCDLRRQRTGEERRRYPGPGLVGLLEGRANLDEVLFVDPKGGPDLIPVTEPAQHSTELLASKQMRLLLAHLRERYDFIIVDTPAVCLTPDAELLAPYADAAVFVIRHRHSTIDRTQRALDLLADASSPLPVAFANMTDTRFFDETYGYEAHRTKVPATTSRPRLPGLRGRPWANAQTAHHRSLTFTKTDFAMELHL